MGKHAFSMTALSMHLIYVTSKTKFTGVKDLGRDEDGPAGDAAAARRQA
jgi:hypothetical protein